MIHESPSAALGTWKLFGFFTGSSADRSWSISGGWLWSTSPSVWGLGCVCRSLLLPPKQCSCRGHPCWTTKGCSWTGSPTGAGLETGPSCRFRENGWKWSAHPGSRGVSWLTTYLGWPYIVGWGLWCKAWKHWAPVYLGSAEHNKHELVSHCFNSSQSKKK